MEFLISFFWVLLQCTAALIFFDAFFQRRHSSGLHWVCGASWALLSCFVMNLLGPLSSGKKLVLVPLLYWLAGVFLYTGPRLMQLVIAFLYHALSTVISYLVLFAAVLITGNSWITFLYDVPSYILTGSLQSFAVLAFALLIRRFHTPVEYDRQNKNWMLLTVFFPLASILTIFLLYSAALGVHSSSYLMMICTVILLISNLIVLLVIENLQKSTREHEALLAVNERMQAQEQSLNALDAAYSAQRKLTHDFRRHLSVLTEFLRQNHKEEALNYLEQLSQQQTERILPINTHHAAMDAVLNQKFYAARKSGIDIQFEVNDLSALKIKSIDSTVVLGNLLDNAIEACQKLPADAPRWIQASVVLTPEPDGKSASLFVSVLNPSQPVLIKDNSVATTKEDPSLHGFGLLAVQDVLKKYHAESVLSYTDGCFLFSIEWPDLYLE